MNYNILKLIIDPCKSAIYLLTGTPQLHNFSRTNYHRPWYSIKKIYLLEFCVMFYTSFIINYNKKKRKK